MDDQDIEQFQFPSGTAGVNNLLPKGNIGLLKAFKAFVAHQMLTGSPIGDTGWITITCDQFDEYRVSPTHTLRASQPTQLHQPQTNYAI